MQTSEAMKLFGGIKKLIEISKNSKNILNLQVIEVVLVQCNFLDNQYQQKPEVLYTFTPNKSHTYLLNVEPKNLVLLKTYNIEFNDIISKLTDQNGRLLETDYKVNLTLFINK